MKSFKFIFSLSGVISSFLVLGMSLYHHEPSLLLIGWLSSGVWALVACLESGK